jgi:uncharacterized repeat protein (TIGR03803 family)
MSKLNGWKMRCCLLLISVATATGTRAQTFNTLVQFTYANGADPFAGLVQGPDGNLYGTTAYGGTCTLYDLGCGTVFKMSPSGVLRTLHYFVGPDGAFPFGQLVLATDGNFYGTTVGGGANCAASGGCGTVFKITPSGSLTTLYSFCSQPNCVDGDQPYGGLIQAPNGNLYGTTTLGGASASGTVFQITGAGNLTTLASFPGPPGGFSPAGNLVQGANGTFYGTTTVGGVNCGGSGCGTVFSVTLGKLETVYSFCDKPDCTDGELPSAGLILAADGNFYGTTSLGGENNTDCAAGCGTVFKITPKGVLTTLHTFIESDGFDPSTALVQANDENFYGTTVEGGYDVHCPGGCGTIFQMMSSGALTTLYTIPTFSDGTDLRGQLLQDTNGTFFGTTYVGGSDGAGTVFSLDTGLSPFVAFVQAVGRVGQTCDIMGQGFTGTTSVVLNGSPASFTVVSDTFIKATVPPGATSGYVTVSTPTGVLTSNVVFRVIE